MSGYDIILSWEGILADLTFSLLSLDDLVGRGGEIRAGLGFRALFAGGVTGRFSASVLRGGVGVFLSGSSLSRWARWGFGHFPPFR